MKAVFLVFSLIVAAQSFAGFPADVEYCGTGVWKMKGSSTGGEYSSCITIKGNETVMTLKFPGTDPFTFRMTAHFEDENYFTIKNGEESIGRGYCLENRCHYSSVFGGGLVEETWFFRKNGLDKIGSKAYGDKFVYWSEKLEVQE